MSDFGAVYDYALALEASIPVGTMAEFEVIRPAVLGLTKRQKEEQDKLAAMEPEDRVKAEAEIAKRKEEALAKYQEGAAKKAADIQAQAQRSAAQHPAPAPAPDDKRK